MKIRPTLPLLLTVLLLAHAPHSRAQDLRQYWRYEIQPSPTDPWSTAGLIMLTRANNTWSVNPLTYTYAQRLTATPEKVTDASLIENTSLTWTEHATSPAGAPVQTHLHLQFDHDTWQGPRTINNKPAGQARLLPVHDLSQLHRELQSIAARIELEQKASAAHAQSFEQSLRFWSDQFAQADTDQNITNGIAQSDILAALARPKSTMQTALKLEQAQSLRLSANQSETQKALKTIEASLPKNTAAPQANLPDNHNPEKPLPLAGFYQAQIAVPNPKTKAANNQPAPWEDAGLVQISAATIDGKPVYEITLFDWSIYSPNQTAPHSITDITFENNTLQYTEHYPVNNRDITSLTTLKPNADSTTLQGQYVFPNQTPVPVQFIKIKDPQSLQSHLQTIVKNLQLQIAAQHGVIPVAISEVRLLGAQMDTLRKNNGNEITSPTAKAYNAAKTALSMQCARELQLQSKLAKAQDTQTQPPTP